MADPVRPPAFSMATNGAEVALPEIVLRNVEVCSGTGRSSTWPMRRRAVATTGRCAR